MVREASDPPVVRFARVKLAGWPAKVRPMRLILISDLHVSTPGDTPDRLGDTVERINTLHPDVVLIAGDFRATGIEAARSYSIAKTVAPLGGLTPRLGTFAILGNHDYDDPAQMRKRLADEDVTLLDNQSARVGPLGIVAISDIFSKHADVSAALRSWHRMGGIPIVLTHSPDVIPDLPPSVTLALAGHTHCGQVSIPFYGPPTTQSRYGRRYSCGLVREGARISIISAGLGVSGWPIRLGAPPDLWVIDVSG
jgi:predicted MPP superfamily phosphohydrolase